MKTRDQFIANERTVPEIAEFITADSLGYLSLKGLISALKHPRDDVCIGCLTGEYPVPIPGEATREEGQPPGAARVKPSGIRLAVPHGQRRRDVRARHERQAPPRVVDHDRRRRDEPGQ